MAAGREFAVIGTTLYEADQFGTLTSRGTVASSSSPATISYNGDGGGQLFITSGTNGYIFDMSTSVLTQVSALNGKATMGDYLDGYFLELDATTSTMYISNLSAGLTWSTGTNFAQRSKQPDPWVSMKVAGNYIWLFGELTAELWYDTGASFPFAPHPSGQVPYGVAAPFSVATIGNGVAWLGTSAAGGVYVLHASGFVPEVISSLPLQLALSRYAVVSDAVADSYTEMGHTFYVLNFPTQQATWAWDATTGQWAERGTWMTEMSTFEAWRPRYHAYAFNEHRMLDARSAAIYRMSSAVSTDVDDLLIRRLRRAPTITSEKRRLYHSSLELFLEPGLGATTGQGSDPQVSLRWSNDGSKTWGSDVFRSAGKIGQYSHRVRWNRLGSARQRTYEVAVSDPIPWRLTGAGIDVHGAARQAQAEA